MTRSRRVLAGAALAGAIVAGCASATTSSPTLLPTARPTASPSPTAAPTASPEPSPTPLPLDEELLAGRLTVLVAGMDTSASRRAGGQRETNTDALMVVSISADRSRIDVISLPRDTVDIPMADGSVYRGKVNAIADRLGIEALRGAMAALLGVEIDRYVQVDMDDFVWMVDAVGGIRVEVTTRVSDPKVHLRLEPGVAHLDGATALAFSRTRADTDYARAARQQQVVLALVHQWLDPGARALLAAALQLGSLETDVSLAELPTLLEIGRRSTAAEVTAIVLQPPRYSLFVGFEPNTTRGWVMIPDVAEIRRYVREALTD
jgi:LCP family protein required for cell wall assembly